MGNPAHGKGHEERGLAKHKGRIRPRGPLGFSRAFTPKTRVCLLYYIMPFNYSSNINRGLSPYHLFREKVNLELLDNKSLGIIRVFQSKNPSDGFLACLTRLSGLLQLCM